MLNYFHYFQLWHFPSHGGRIKTKGQNRMNWSDVLSWAMRHANDVSQFIGLLMAVKNASGLLAKLRAFGALYMAIQEILKDFPMPTVTSEVFREAVAGTHYDFLTANGVAELDAKEVQAVFDSGVNQLM
jgi:hypothetical protein